MTRTLMQLPYDASALEPSISTETIQYHYGKHHEGYLKKLIALTEGTPYEDMRLTEIIKSAKDAVFNNASQVYNHNVYFQGLTPDTSQMTKVLEEQILQDFGSLEQFKTLFLQTAANLFGSGWVWLSLNAEKRLIIEGMSNADSPLLYGHTPLMTCDVWEHAYYIDYRNARADYLEKWWNLINWDFVSENFGNAEYIEFACDEKSGACG